LRFSQIRESRNPAISLVRLFSPLYGWHGDCPNKAMTPPQAIGGGNFEEREDVRGLSYGADNRMAKSASIGQVYPNTAANHQQ
jgi:hypothetical protein